MVAQDGIAGLAGMVGGVGGFAPAYKPPPEGGGRHDPWRRASAMSNGRHYDGRGVRAASCRARQSKPERPPRKAGGRRMRASL